MSNFISALLALVPLLLIGLFLHYQKQQHNKRFAHPLWESESMRRPPGAFVGQKLVAQTHEAMSHITQLCLVSVIVSLLVYTRALSSGLVMGLLVLIFGAWFIYTMRKLFKLQENIRNNRLGYECELVVGQELNLLMLDGWQVFHDVLIKKKPNIKFNIDHILVGAGGVFAVETKGKSKPRLNGQKTHEVAYKDEAIYEDDVLYYSPEHWDDKSTKQAARQSKDASNWLTQATGQDVPVHPVVVLPGWDIKRKGTAAVPVLSLEEIHCYFRKKQNQVLSPEQVKQVVYQIEQKVKDLTPRELTDPRSYK